MKLRVPYQSVPPARPRRSRHCHDPPATKPVPPPSLLSPLRPVRVFIRSSHGRLSPGLSETPDYLNTDQNQVISQTIIQTFTSILTHNTQMSTILDAIREASGRNADLLGKLAETDAGAAGLPSQTSLVSDLKRQITANEANLQRLDRRRQSELADHEKYRDSNVRRFLFRATGQSDKFAERAEKEQKEYYDVLQEQHEKTVVNDGLKTQLEEAEGVKAEMEVADALHREAQGELENLYHSIFSGETPRFPEEDALEEGSNAALQQYHDVRVRWEEEGRVVAALKKARDTVKVSLDHMDDARSASRMDMMGFDGIADAMERSSLAKAEVSYREAKSLAAQAGYTDLPDVNINHGHFFRDVFFDNIFSDMQFHEEIKRGQMEMQKFADALTQRMTRSRDRQAAAGDELKQMEVKLEDARKRLQDKRAELFEQFAEKKDRANL